MGVPTPAREAMQGLGFEISAWYTLALCEDAFFFAKSST
jgi:hypothetical protein